jgi:hypothetical protein
VEQLRNVSGRAADEVIFGLRQVIFSQDGAWESGIHQRRAFDEWYILPDGQNVGSDKGEVFEREVGGKEKKLNCQAGFLRGMDDEERRPADLFPSPFRLPMLLFISKAEVRTIRAHFAMAKVHSAAFRNSQKPHLCVLCDNSARGVSSY